MFAIFLEIETGHDGDADMDAVLTHLNKNVIPRVRDAGARAAYWLDSGGGSRRVALMVFDSEDAARAVADGIKAGQTSPGSPQGIKHRSVEVREVLASL